MKILQVIASIGRPEAGPSYTVLRLAEELQAHSHDVGLHVLRGHDRPTTSVPVHEYPPDPLLRRLCSSRAMRAGLTRLSRDSDVLHNHGLWLLPNLYAGAAVQGSPCRLVVSPRGMLSDWALRHGRWRKRIVWHLGQRTALERAAGFHATAESEAEDIRRIGFRQPVAVVANGIDVPPEPPDAPRVGRRRLLSLGRLHPKKGLDRLLRAWAAVQAANPDWDLVIAGPDEGGHEAELRRLATRLGLPRVSFTGPVYGTAKDDLLIGSDLFVFATHSENFGMVVAEALAHGVPVVSTRGAPWSGLETHRCGFWTDNNEQAIREGLARAMALPIDELRAMGRRGRLWMVAEFGWPGIGERMASFYDWLCGRGERPACALTS